MLDQGEALVDQSPKQQAWDLYRKGRYQDALNIYNTHLGNYQNDPWYVHNRALTLIELGNEDSVREAVSDLEKIRVKLPDDAQIYASLAIATGRSGNYAKCLEYYKKAAQLDPDNYEVKIVTLDGSPPVIARNLHERGLEFLQNGNYREALRYYDAAIAFGGEIQSVWSIHDKGIALMRLGHHAEAIKTLKKAKELIPESPIPLIDIAQAYQLLGRALKEKGGIVNYPINKKVIAYLEEALKIDPNNIQVLSSLQQLDPGRENRNKYHTYRKIAEADGSVVWIDQDGNPVTRSVTKERAAIPDYFNEIKQMDPDYFSYLETLNQTKTMRPMDGDCRVAINIPAWLEGKNIYTVLNNYSQQIDRQGNPLDSQIFEFNIIINRKTGTSPDETVQEIERFIRDTGGKYNINYIDVEFDPPFNNVEHARKVITDLTLLRSLRRTDQTKPLYIESEDADLIDVDPRTVIHVIDKFDSNPYLDAVRGIQDRPPALLKDNDYLLLEKRLWDFSEIFLRSRIYRLANNPKWHPVWNRIVTGGWNTAYTAEAYALIHGYKNLINSEDMDIGIRITEMRGDASRPNLDVIGTVSSRSSSSPRRSIEGIYSQRPIYGERFEDIDVNIFIKSTPLPDLMKKIEFVARIDGSNLKLFEQLLINSFLFYREVTPNEEAARKHLDRVLFWIGFQKEDYTFTSEGELRITNWENLKKTLEKYRERFKIH